MPMTSTHALVPIAAAVAFANRPVPWRLVIAAAVAAALPDADWVAHHFFRAPETSIYAHRGAAHSLFAALIAAFIAAGLHKKLNVSALVAGVVIGASVATHGVLDMMTDSGQGVAILWPLSSSRLFADWRPIHSGPVHMAHAVSDALARLPSELMQIILPMFAIALVIRGARMLSDRARTDLRS